MESENSLCVFEGKEVRRILHNDEWHFSVIDVIAVLTESPNSRRYWSDLKIKLKQEGVELYGFIVQLKLLASDGKKYLTDCANIKSMFRLIQSIPSKKAEPFKQWLAKIGYERVQEIENPELAQKRMREIYQQKGYSDQWIEKRVRGIAVRDELTDEWDKRGVKTQKEFAILTAEISKATFGLTPNEYKQVKGLKREKLRDHMNDLELIFSMLGEAATTEITKNKDSLGFNQNQKSAKEGGEIAGNARNDLEQKSGKKVTTSENYLRQPEKIKRLERKNNN